MNVVLKVDKTSEALLSCLLEVYGAAEAVAEDPSPSSSMQHLLVNNARAKCGTALDEAERAEKKPVFKTSIIKSQMPKKIALPSQSKDLADGAIKASWLKQLKPLIRIVA